MKYCKIALLSINIFFITSSLNTAYAATITSDLTLSAEIDFDLSVDPLNATQNATIAINGDSRSVDGISVQGGNTPLTGLLSHVNDTLSFTGNIAGTANTSDLSEALLFSDFLIDIQNVSATTAYQLTFRIDYQLTAETNGFDATSLASVNIFDTQSPKDLIFDDEASSDTLFSPGQFSTGLVTNFFDVLVDPLSSIALAGAFGIDGIAFDIDDNFNVFNSTQIALTDVVALSANVPEPSALMLFLIGLFGFRFSPHGLSATK